MKNLWYITINRMSGNGYSSDSVQLESFICEIPYPEYLHVIETQKTLEKQKRGYMGYGAISIIYSRRINKKQFEQLRKNIEIKQFS